MQHFLDIERFDYKFSTAKCAACNFVSINPRPNKRLVGKLYKSDYFHGEGFDKSVNYIEGLKNFESNRIIFSSRLKNIEKFVEKGILLDAGCGVGDFLMAAKERGWKAEGVEISDDAAKICRENGIRVYTTSLESMKIKNRYDCVVMVEVIEHLIDPVSSLKNCYGALKEGGLIAIQTDNIESIYARLTGKKWFYFLYGHLNYFSPRTLKVLLEKTGFKVERIYFGDEIRLVAKVRSYWKQKSRLNIKNWSGFIKMLVTQTVRNVHIGDLSMGGMVFYARKV